MENNHFVLYWFCQFWTTLMWILMNMMLIVDFDCMYIFHLRPFLIFPKLHNKNKSFSWYFEDDYVITDWEAPVALGNHCSHLLPTGVRRGGSVWWHRIILVRLFIPLSCHIMYSILLARSAPVPAGEDDHDPAPCAAASGAQSTQDTIKLNDEINLLHCTQYK